MGNILFDLYKEREQIKKMTFKEFFERDHWTARVYKDYARAFRVFHTIKNYPEFYFNHECCYPQYSKISEIFNQIVILGDGVKNKNKAKRPLGYIFLANDTLWKEELTKAREVIKKPFIMTYASLKDDLQDEIKPHMIGTIGSFSIVPMTSIDGTITVHQIRATDQMMIANIPVAYIRNMDLTPQIDESYSSKEIH